MSKRGSPEYASTMVRGVLAEAIAHIAAKDRDAMIMPATKRAFFDNTSL